MLNSLTREDMIKLLIGAVIGLVLLATMFITYSFIHKYEVIENPCIACEEKGMTCKNDSIGLRALPVLNHLPETGNNAFTGP